MTMLHHAGLCPADIETSLCFYRDGIGLEVLGDFTMDVDLEPLLGRRTRHIRAVFLGSADSPQDGTLELLDLGEPELGDEPPGPGIPHRGLFLLSFQVPVADTLDRLARLGFDHVVRTMEAPGGVTATVVDPDGVAVELLSGPITQLPSRPAGR